MNTLKITNNIEIPLSEFEWEYVRSSGPGGQNVNRTNSCVVLRWNYLNSALFKMQQLTPEVLTKLETKANKQGEIIIRSQTHRDQSQNYQECLDKLINLLRQFLYKPKKRVKTKPTYSSKKKRLDSKKMHAQKKETRRKIRD